MQVAGGLLAAVVVVPLLVPGSALGRALSAIVGGSSGLSTNGRAQLWAQAFDLLGKHPFLGVGTGGFAALNAEPYPHNILLEAGSELGILIAGPNGQGVVSTPAQLCAQIVAPYLRRGRANL